MYFELAFKLQINAESLYQNFVYSSILKQHHTLSNKQQQEPCLSTLIAPQSYTYRHSSIASHIATHYKQCVNVCVFTPY